MRALLTLALVTAASPSAIAGIKIGNIGSSHNPGIYLDTTKVEDLEEDETDAWPTLDFEVASGYPDGKSKVQSKFEKKGAFCSLLVTDWFALPDPMKPFDFSSWTKDVQLEKTKEFLTLDYAAQAEANEALTEEEQLACDTPWTQKRAMQRIPRLRSKKRESVLRGLKQKWAPGTLIYISTGNHAIGVRILDDKSFALYDPNSGQAVLMPRDAAESTVDLGTSFLVAKPAH